MATLPGPDALGHRPAPSPSLGVARYQPTSPGELEAPGVATMAAGDSAMRTGNHVYAEMKQETERLDNLRAQDAINKLTAQSQELARGEGGYMTKVGEAGASKDLIPEYRSRFDLTAKGISDTLENDNQKAIFKRYSAPVALHYADNLYRHRFAQEDALSQQVTAATIDTETRNIAANPMNDAVVGAALVRMKAALRDQEKRFGWAPDSPPAKAAAQAAMDKAWMSRIDALLVDKPIVAYQLFRANAQDITNPELRLLLKNKTSEAALGMTANLEANDIITGVRDAAPSPLAPQAPRAIENGPAVGMTDTGGKPGKKGDQVGQADFPVVTAEQQKGRDEGRLAILKKELAAERDPENVARLNREISRTEAAIRNPKGPGAQKVQYDSPAENPMAQNTSGMPNSRDVAAQLPLMLAKVEERANALYGRDPGNPDRAAFIRQTQAQIQSKVSSDVQQLNVVQRQAQGTLIDAISGMQGGMVKTGADSPRQNPITSFAQIQSNPELFRAWQMATPEAKLSLTSLMEKNLAANDHGDVVLFRSLFNRIHLDPSDPKKIDFYEQIITPEVADRLSMTQISQLRAELDRDATPGGRSLNQMRKAADANVSTFFKTNMMFTAQPERALAATMKWNEDVGRKIDDYYKTGKDIRSLFMLDSKDSVVSPAYLQTYVNTTPSAGLATQAGQVKSGEALPVAAVPQPKEIDTRDKLNAWFQTLPANVTTFVGTDGKTYAVPARVQAQPNSTGAVAAPPTPATATMDATGKLVTPPAAPAAAAPVVDVSVDDFKFSDKPETVAGNIAALRKARERALEIRRQGAQGPQFDLLGPAVSAVRGAQAAAGAVGEAIQAGMPTEMEAVLAGFQAIKKSRKVSMADEDILTESLKYGQLSAEDEALAKALLKKIDARRK